jgi:hypothetical protein
MLSFQIQYPNPCSKKQEQPFGLMDQGGESRERARNNEPARTASFMPHKQAQNHHQREAIAVDVVANADTKRTESSDNDQRERKETMR